MKQSLIVIVTAFCCIINMSYGQTELIYGNYSPKEKKLNAKLFARTADEHLIAFFSSKKSQYLSRYDKDLNLKFESKIDVSEYGDVKALMINDETVNLISYKYDRKNKTITYYWHHGNSNDFKLKSEELLVLDDDTAKSYFGVAISFFFINNGINHAESFGFGQIFTSRNDKFFSIVLDIKDKTQQRNKVFTFNDAFELINQTTFTKDAKDKLVDIQSIHISDNTGSVFLVTKNYHNNSTKEKYSNKINYHFELIKLADDKVSTIDLNTNKLFIDELKFFSDEKGLYLVGFSSDESAYKQKGLFVTSIAEDNLSQNVVKAMTFDKDYIASATQRNSNLSMSKTYVKNYEIEKFMTLNASHYLFSQTKYMSNPGSTGAVYLKHGNISIIKLDKDFNLVDYRIIDRNTAAECTFQRIKDKFILHFWGFKKSKKKIDTYKTIRGKSKLLELQIDEDLNLTENEYDSMLFAWLNYFNFNNEYALYFSIDKNKKRLIKLAVK